MNPDLEIARAAVLRPIADIAARLNIPAGALEPYGRHKAKIGFDVMNSVQDRPDGHLACGPWACLQPLIRDGFREFLARAAASGICSKFSEKCASVVSVDR